ncbi:hypothetical protein MMC19_006055 [Ptychographa xylographoides]|nr:hypothetical protein [Ptychographa xylographoides]
MAPEYVTDKPLPPTPLSRDSIPLLHPVQLINLGGASVTGYADGDLDSVDIERSQESKIRLHLLTSLQETPVPIHDLYKYLTDEDRIERIWRYIESWQRERGEIPRRHVSNIVLPTEPVINPHDCIHDVVVESYSSEVVDCTEQYIVAWKNFLTSQSIPQKDVTRKEASATSRAASTAGLLAHPRLRALRRSPKARELRREAQVDSAVFHYSSGECASRTPLPNGSLGRQQDALSPLMIDRPRFTSITWPPNPPSERAVTTQTSASLYLTLNGDRHAAKSCTTAPVHSPSITSSTLSTIRGVSACLYTSFYTFVNEHQPSQLSEASAYSRRLPRRFCNSNIPGPWHRRLLKRMDPQTLSDLAYGRYHPSEIGAVYHPAEPLSPDSPVSSSPSPSDDSPAQPFLNTTAMENLAIYGRLAYQGHGRKTGSLYDLLDQLDKILIKPRPGLSTTLMPIVMRFEIESVQKLRNSRFHYPPPSNSLGATRHSANVVLNLLPREHVNYLDLVRAVYTAQYVISGLWKRIAPGSEDVKLNLQGGSEFVDPRTAAANSGHESRRAALLRSLKVRATSLSAIILPNRVQTRAETTTERLERISKGLYELGMEILKHIWPNSSPETLKLHHNALLKSVITADGHLIA